MKSIADAEASVRPVLKFNESKLEELRKASGIRSKSEFARLIGINPATLWRVTDGDLVPSNEVIAKVKLAFPLVSLDDLVAVAA